MSPNTFFLGCINILPCLLWASQVALVVKNLPANAGDVKEVGSIPGLGRTPGGRNGNPLHYYALENSMDYSIGSQRVRHDCYLAYYIINILEKAWLNVNTA